MTENFNLFQDPELTSLFIETTLESLDELNDGMLGLEGAPEDESLLNSVFRAAHNIKGSSGAAGLEGVNRVTHNIETVLDLLRRGTLRLDDDLVAAIFESVDRLREVIESFRDGTHDDVGENEPVGLFEKWMEPSATDRAERAPVPSSEPSATSERHGGAAGNTIDVVVRFAESGDAPIQAYLVHNRLAGYGVIAQTDPDLDSLTAASRLSRVTFRLISDVPVDQIRRGVEVFDVEGIEIDAGAEAQAELDAARNGDVTGTAVNTAANSQQRSVVRTGATVRVDFDRLDQLMNLGGELVINKARFVQIFGRLRELIESKHQLGTVDDVAEQIERLKSSRSSSEVDACSRRIDNGFTELRRTLGRIQDARLALQDFDEALHGLNRVSEGLQKGIMGARMVPIGPLFNRFRRVVRDIAKARDKQVRLELSGEQTELDKRMIDELGDPLTHMIRNAVDHGIESAETRERNGKSPTGTVILRASRRGNSICIEVNDDGGGIDVDRVRRKVVEKGLATSSQVQQMSDREIIQFVLRPGFSTAAEVTDLSGRGMGMDIVATRIEQLNGTVEIDSTRDKGTSITVRLPLTLAIVTSMVARIGEGIYALPLEGVCEIVTVRKTDTRRIDRCAVVSIRDRIVPIACFEDVFDTDLDDLQTKTKASDELTVVVIGMDNDRVGLVVDELFGQEDVVVKSTAENYRHVRGVAGASIRGDGGVSLILDLVTFIEMAGQRVRVSRTVAEEPNVPVRRTTCVAQEGNEP